MVIDLRVRRRDDDAIQARERLVAAEVPIDLVEDIVEEPTVALVDLADAEEMNPHPALRDRLDHLLAGEAADVAFAPALLRGTLRAHVHQRVVLARIGLDQLFDGFKGEERMLVQAMGQAQRRLAPVLRDVARPVLEDRLRHTHYLGRDRKCPVRLASIVRRARTSIQLDKCNAVNSSFIYQLYPGPLMTAVANMKKVVSKTCSIAPNTSPV